LQEHCERLVETRSIRRPRRDRLRSTCACAPRSALAGSAQLSSAPLSWRFIDANISPLNSTNRSQSSCKPPPRPRQTSQVSIAILLEDGVRTPEFEQPRANAFNNTQHY
jgi:hypothetical protein